MLCTGARPSIPPIDGLADVDYLTYETIWGLDELPLRLAVVGGGPIGCEIAQAFCRLGSSVSLVEGAYRIMLQDEPEAAEVVAQKLVQDGVDLRTNAPLQQVEKTAKGVRLYLAGDVQVEVDRVLVCVGRRPLVEGLGLDAANVNHGRGGIEVNNHLRTTQANIYAAGDCTRGDQFTHYASYQGFMAVRNDFFPSTRNLYWNEFPGPLSPTQRWPTSASPKNRQKSAPETRSRLPIGPWTRPTAG